MTTMDIDDDTMLFLSEQRHELTAAIAADTDLDFAYHLQLQEAITASQTTTTEVPEPPSGIAHLLASEINSFNRYYNPKQEVELAKNEMRKMHENVNMLLHDQCSLFAREVMDVNEHDEENVGGVGRVRVGGIGVAICDTRDSCVFEVKKGVTVSAEDILELKSVIEVLECMRGLREEMKEIVDQVLPISKRERYTDYDDETNVGVGLEEQVNALDDVDSDAEPLTGKRRPTNNTTVTLVDQLNLIQRKFAYCGAYLVRQNDIMFAYKLARDAISSQVTRFAENSSGKTLLEQCTICFDSINSGQMFSVNKCLHRYCYSCMRKHVEAKLLQAQLPECPHEGCKSHLEIECCKKFLNQELYDIMSLRIREASIPPTEKVYCPFSNCSALMSKSEVKEYTATSSAAGQGTGMRKCVKCRRLFCVNCKVPWHDKFTCSDYKRYYPSRSASEAKLKDLASRNHWRQYADMSFATHVELSGSRRNRRATVQSGMSATSLTRGVEIDLHLRDDVVASQTIRIGVGCIAECAEARWFAVIIIEYFVKINKKARILELKRKKYEEYCFDILYAVSIKEDTAYMCLHFIRNHEEQRPIRRIQKTSIRRIQDIVIKYSGRY
ncbi:ribonuclease H domain-containing protein [Tanacetum coccineum]